jgi:hypothetical protein
MSNIVYLSHYSRSQAEKLSAELIDLGFVALTNFGYPGDPSHRFKAIRGSDYFVLFLSHGIASSGRSVEFGYALGQACDLFTVGVTETPNMFNDRHFVVHVEDTEKLVEELKREARIGAPKANVR